MSILRFERKKLQYLRLQKTGMFFNSSQKTYDSKLKWKKGTKTKSISTRVQLRLTHRIISKSVNGKDNFCSYISFSFFSLPIFFLHKLKHCVQHQIRQILHTISVPLPLILKEIRIRSSKIMLVEIKGENSSCISK